MYLQRGVSLDAQQLLDRAVPGHVVGHRRDVVHPVGDRDVLVVVEVLAELLEARVQIADVGHGVDHALAVELQHQPQRRVRGRMLRTEVERPQVILRLVVGQVVEFRLAAKWHVIRAYACPCVSTGKLCRSPRPCSG